MEKIYPFANIWEGQILAVSNFAKTSISTQKIFFYKTDVDFTF